jgi:segregation and condensation protein A
MEFILLHFKQKPNFLFSDLFEATTTITTIVATFLAVLELTRLGEILIKQDRSFSDIRCERGTNTGFTFNSSFT